MKIIAINKKTKVEEEITDLYWFEHEYIHSLQEDSDYEFKFIIEDGDNISVDDNTKIVAGLEREYSHDIEFFDDMKEAENKYNEAKEQFGDISEDESTAFIAVVLKSEYYEDESSKRWRGRI